MTDPRYPIGAFVAPTQWDDDLVALWRGAIAELPRTLRATVAGLDNAALRELGRLPCPMVRRRGEKGFTRVSWADVHARLGARLRATDPARLAFFITARGAMAASLSAATGI